MSLDPNAPAPTAGPAVARPGPTAAGLLPSQHLERLVHDGALAASEPITPAQVQPASIDLRLGAVGYQVRASFLPGPRATVMDKLEPLRAAEPLDLTRPVRLRRGHVYIVPLLEHLQLPDSLLAKANPKSTTGRLDVFVRLIADRGTEFDRVPAGYHGPLYAEIAPRTFDVIVRKGDRLNQLRVAQGMPAHSDAVLDELHRRDTLVFGADDAPAEPSIANGLWLTVDLAGAHGGPVIGYRARRDRPEAIDLQRIGHYDPAEFWEPVHARGESGIVLEPDDFYILVSREKIRVPPTHAAEMVAYEPPIGEFRVHYAGFFDPGFGHGNDQIKGTRGVLEVRSHEVPFLLEDGQTVGRLLYERLLEIPDRLYGQDIGSSYQGQGLALSKQFARG